MSNGTVEIGRPIDLQLEEHGITIPAPTPTSINLPNPWKPNGSTVAAETAPNGAPLSQDEGSKRTEDA